MNSTLVPSRTPTLERPLRFDTDPDPEVRLRPLDIADIDDASRIVFEAFTGIAARHGFPSDFPTLESARQLVSAFTEHPSIWGVAADCNGRLVGTNFLDERVRDIRSRLDPDGVFATYLGPRTDLGNPAQPALRDEASLR